MAVEARRGCGYRRAGGLYLVGEFGNPVSVPWLPFCVDYAQTRSIEWAESARLFRTVPPGERSGPGFAEYAAHERIGLMWVGERHYKTSAAFSEEALSLGVSKRIAAIPQGLKPGDPIALAHPRAISTFADDTGGHVGTHCRSCWGIPAAKVIANVSVGAWRHRVRSFALLEEPAYCITYDCQRLRVRGTYHCTVCTPQAPVGPNGELRPAPVPVDPAAVLYIAGYGDPLAVAGVFGLFRMRQVELVLPQSAITEAIVERCAERCIRIVPVPDGDPDHVQPGWKLPAFLRDPEPEDGAAVLDSDEDELPPAGGPEPAAPFEAQGRLF